MTVCQPIVMMFAFPFHSDDTSTMGPGSRYRRMFETGKSDFAGRLRMSPSLRRCEDGYADRGMRLSTSCPAFGSRRQLKSPVRHLIRFTANRAHEVREVPTFGAECG